MIKDLDKLKYELEQAFYEIKKCNLALKKAQSNLLNAEVKYDEIDNDIFETKMELNEIF